MRMKKVCCLLVHASLNGFLLTMGNIAWGQGPDSARPLPTESKRGEENQIDPASFERLKTDIEQFSSDGMEGRGPNTEGLRIAGDLIAARWKELGLRTDHFDGTPFQEFGVPGPMKITDEANNQLSLQGPGSPVNKLELGRDFTSVSLGSNGSFSGPLAFVGYGISAKGDLQYDDYEGIDVKGKVVIVIRKEPQQNDPSSPFAGKDPSDYSFYSAKESNAAKHGAAAMLIVNDSITAAGNKPWTTETRNELLADLDAISELRKEIETAEADLPIQSKLAASIEERLRKLQERLKTVQQSGDVLPAADGAGRAFGRNRVPTIFVKRAWIEPILKASMGLSLAEWEASVDRDLKPRSKVLEGWTATGKAETKESKIPVRNVVALLPGVGNLAKEYVVVGAHYDHVGMGGAGSLAPGTYAVHNGADDNGSGTVSLLEVSRKLIATLPKDTDRRTIVFIAFSAEELGLLGSQHYVANPRFPIEDTVAMVNMDMVGRLASNTLTVYGTGTAVEFDKLIEETNQRYRFELDKSPEGMGPSDHASFFEAKIPVFHFFTGLHPDYHRPSDDFDKINVTGMVRITDMVTDVVQQIATQASRPEFVAVRGYSNPRQQSENRGRLQVTISDGDEVAIESMEPGGSAEKAGLLVGDKIVSLDNKPVESMVTLRKILEGKRPGDTLPIEVIRENERKKMDIRLGK